MKAIDFDDAVAIFRREYEKVKQVEYVRNPLGQAMYSACKIVNERETKEQDEIDKLFNELFERNNKND